MAVEIAPGVVITWAEALDVAEQGSYEIEPGKHRSWDQLVKLSEARVAADEEG